jgi:hypothetical protein
MEKYCTARQATDDYGANALHAGYLRLQTFSEYVICIAFPLQQWLHERASLYTIRTLPVLLINMEISFITIAPKWWNTTLQAEEFVVWTNGSQDFFFIHTFSRLALGPYGAQ